MKILISLTCLILAGFTAAAPAINNNDEKIIVTKEFYPDAFVKYKSKHDIINLMVPINSLNFDENDSSSEELDADITLFFVEADIDANGKPTYQGLYIFKKNEATKLMENGRDAAASGDDSPDVFIGAQDGIYVYKSEKNSVVKYGSVTDSIINIEKTNNSDVIYILTEDHEVFKITNKGDTKTKVDEISNAQHIVLDYIDNLYFYGLDLQPYVLTANGVKKIDGLPSSPSKVDLIKPPFILEDGVPFIVDNVAYIIYANGTSELTDFEFTSGAKPTAYAMETALVQYYAYDKKIYQYNLLEMILGAIIDEFKDYLTNKADDIQSLASKTRRNKID